MTREKLGRLRGGLARCGERTRTKINEGTKTESGEGARGRRRIVAIVSRTIFRGGNRSQDAGGEPGRNKAERDGSARNGEILRAALPVLEAPREIGCDLFERTASPPIC